MSSFIKVATAATSAPVALADALRHLRALESDSDMVWTYLQAAVAAVEDYTGRSLVTKTYDLILSEWPEDSLQLELRRTPLIAVTHVKYYADGAAVLSTLASTNYRVITGREPGLLEFVDDISWPDLDVREDAVEIRFTAGYGTAVSGMPAALRTACLMLAHHWYDERKPVVTGATPTEMPLSLRHLLQAYRVRSELLIP